MMQDRYEGDGVSATLAIGIRYPSPTYRAHLSRYRSVFFLDVVGHRDQTSVLLSRTAIGHDRSSGRH